LRHTGTYVFDYNTHEQLYKDLRVMFDPEAAQAAAVKAAAAAEEVAAMNATIAATPAVLADSPPAEVKTEVLASSKKKSKKEAAEA